MNLNIRLVFQAGSPHLGMEYNQGGSSKQPDRGSNWMPGPPGNPAIGQLPGPPPFTGQVPPGNQAARPPSVIVIAVYILHVISMPILFFYIQLILFCS